MLHRNCPVCDKKTGEKIEHICQLVNLDEFIKFVLHLSYTFFILYKCMIYTQSFP